MSDILEYLKLISGPMGGLVTLAIVCWLQRADIKDLRAELKAKDEIVTVLLKDSIKADFETAAANKELASETRAANAGRRPA